MPSILVTGGAGFIGSSFVRLWIAEEDGPVVNLDKLTYAGNLDSLAPVAGDSRHTFVEGDICDGPLVSRLFEEHRPEAVVNFAAESHVDRSIDGPAAFVETNVVGTFRLLWDADAIVFHADQYTLVILETQADPGLCCFRVVHDVGEGLAYDLQHMNLLIDAERGGLQPVVQQYVQLAACVELLHRFRQGRAQAMSIHLQTKGGEQLA